MSVRFLPAAALAVLLAACGDEAPQEGQVSGEVLEGTISDEMLELEQVRSRAPLADPTGNGAGSSESAGAAPNTGEQAPAETAEEPAEVPAEADE